MAIVGLGLILLAKKSGVLGASSRGPVRIGAIQTSVTTQASVNDILGAAQSQILAGEDPTISRLRTQVNALQLKVVAAADQGPYGVYDQLSNGWSFPDWLVEYLKIPRAIN